MTVTIHAQTVGNVAGRDVVIVSPDSVRPQDVRTVLFVASNPRSTSAVRVLEELREVEEALRLAGVSDQIQIEVVPSARPGDVQAAVLRFQPEIVHVAGHGVAAEIVLESQHGEALPVGAAWLTIMLTGSPTVCVVLNVCQSAELARQIAVGLRVWAIGWDGDVGDDEAISFIRAFYTGIGYGLSFERAFEQARSFVYDHQAMPVLYG